MDGQPTQAVAGEQPYVVRPDRDACRRMLNLFWVLGSVTIAVNLVGLTDTEGWDPVFRGVTVVLWVALVAVQTVLWTRMRAAPALAEVGPGGLRVNILGSGWVSLPWTAVASVREDWASRIVVRTAERIGSGSPGVEWPSDRAAARRARRRKLFIPTRQTHAAANQVLAAVHHFSSGRL